MGIQTLPESICELNISGSLNLDHNALTPQAMGSIQVAGNLDSNNFSGGSAPSPMMSEAKANAKAEGAAAAKIKAEEEAAMRAAQHAA